MYYQRLEPDPQSCLASFSCSLMGKKYKKNNSTLQTLVQHRPFILAARRSPRTFTGAAGELCPHPAAANALYWGGAPGCGAGQQLV